MENRKGENFLSRFLAGLVPEGTNIEFNPNSKALLISRLLDDNGNENIFKIIVDKKEPEIKQRIYTNDSRNNS